MLERCIREPSWLDMLPPGEALEASLAASNEYRDAKAAEPALRDLLRSWLEPPSPMPEDAREIYAGLAAYWNADAELISADVLSRLGEAI